MIIDPKTGKQIFNDIVEITPLHANALLAYSAWATELGLSDTATLPGLVQADDAATEIDIGFPTAIDGLSSKIMQSTEGSIGIYVDEPPGSVSSSGRAITAVAPSQVSVPRAYTSRATINPSFVINCKSPNVDSKSYNGKWVKTADAAILFISWSQYGNSNLNKTDLAIKFSRGNIELVCTAGTDAGSYIQFFIMDSTSASGQALVGNGNFGKQLTPSNTYQFRSVSLKKISGQVIGENGTGIITDIRAYLRSNGLLVGSTTSDSSGDYLIETAFPDEHYVVCLAEDSSALNALVFDRVIPID